MKAVLVICVLAVVASAVAEDLDPVVVLDANKNVIEVPVVCKEGERPDANGRCRPIFSSPMDLQVMRKVMMELLKCQENPSLLVCKKLSVDSFSVIDVPITCPAGYRPDANGRCRPIHRSLEWSQE